ncbi:unnamed protein product [Caenorhabditis nigoni]
MLPIKKAVTQTVSILGRSVSPTEQLALIKKSNADREIRDLLRQCLISAMNFESSSKESLEKSKTLVRKAGDTCEISSRSAAFTAASAMKLKKWNDVDEMLQMATYCPPAITTSIRVKSLAEQSKFNEALSELEKVLMFEEEVFSTGNYSISDEALNALCDAIKAEPESTEKMKRFRNLQRLVTKYGRRTDKSIEDMLFSPIRLENSEPEEEKVDPEFMKSQKFQDFVKQIPYLKDEKLKS